MSSTLRPGRALVVLLASVHGACLASGPLDQASIRSVSVVVSSTVSIGLNGRRTDGLDVEANRILAQAIASDLQALLDDVSIPVADEHVTVGVPGLEHALLAPRWGRGRPPSRRDAADLRDEGGPFVSDGLEDEQITRLREMIHRGDVSSPLRWTAPELCEMGFGGDLLLIVQVDGYVMSDDDRQENKRRFAMNCLRISMSLLSAMSGGGAGDLDDGTPLLKSWLEIHVQCYDAATGEMLRYGHLKGRCEDDVKVIRRCHRIVRAWFPKPPSESLSKRWSEKLRRR